MDVTNSGQMPQKRKKTGGRKKGTPNKISKKLANALFKEYFMEEIELENGKVERFKALIVELEKLALHSKKELIKVKAIDIILKALGIYNANKIEINNDDNKINIRIIDN